MVELAEGCFAMMTLTPTSTASARIDGSSYPPASHPRQSTPGLLHSAAHSANFARGFSRALIKNSSVPLARGARIGSYEVVDLLGVGGMGEVYRAHDAKLGRLKRHVRLPKRIISCRR